MTAGELVETVVRSGGVLSVDGELLRYELTADCEPLLPELAERKPELVELLQKRGGRVATFPHCPRCASFALYRENNIGDYECLSCSLQNITESTARRVQ